MLRDPNRRHHRSSAARCAVVLALVIGAGVSRDADLSARQASPARKTTQAKWVAEDREIAARFAPIFHQGVIGDGRFDYPTNFDFDGDWVGANNWANAADKKFPLKGYIYYAVSETPTHYFVHYAAFHPRDYKGGEKTGAVLSKGVRAGAAATQKVKKTGTADDVVLAHENDFEGCLVVAEKRGPSLDKAVVVIVETMAHNHYLKYEREPASNSEHGPFQREGEHPILYIEPKGHGIEALDDDSEKPAESRGEPTGGKAMVKRGFGGLMKGLSKVKKVVTLEPPEAIRVYRFTGKAEDPELTKPSATTGTAQLPSVGYELVPIYSTIWTHARGGVNDTYGETQDYGTRTISMANVTAPIKATLGLLGSALRGLAGAANKARPPWGWFDMRERERPLGEWFFDPANTVKRHFKAPGTWSTSYTHEPFLGVLRGEPTPKA